MLFGNPLTALRGVPWGVVIRTGSRICTMGGRLGGPVAVGLCSTVAVLAIGTSFVYETSGYTHVHYKKVWNLGTLSGELSRAFSDISDVQKTLRKVERLPEKLGDTSMTAGDLSNDIYAITDGVKTETEGVFIELRDAAKDAAKMWDSYETAHDSYKADKTNYENCWWFCGSKPKPPQKPFPPNTVTVLNQLVVDTNGLKGRLTTVLDCAKNSCDLEVLEEALKEAEKQNEAMKFSLHTLATQVCTMHKKLPSDCLGMADLGVASLSKPPVSYVGDDASLAMLAGAALLALATAAVSIALRHKPAHRGVPLLQ